MNKVANYVISITWIGILLLITNTKIYGKLHTNNELLPLEYEASNIINGFEFDDENDIENYEENDDNDSDEDFDDEGNYYSDEREPSYTMNSKRDLIKGPSFTPNIDTDIADSELERENVDSEFNLGGSKRKYIPDEFSSGNVSVAPFVSTKHLHLHPTHHAHTSNTSTPKKRSKMLSENTELQKSLVSDNLINLLFDWKKHNTPSTSDHPNNEESHEMFDTPSEGESGDKNEVKSKEEQDAERTILKLRQASHTLSDSIKPTATENDVASTADTIESESTDGNDVNNGEVEPETSAMEPASKEEADFKTPQVKSRNIASVKKNKGKISVMVNVNINERAARRSKVAVANRTKMATVDHAASGTGASGEEKSEASGFLQHYGVLHQSKGDEDSVLNADNPLKAGLGDIEAISGSGTNEIKPETSSLHQLSSHFHPENSTLNIFAGPAFPEHNKMKILNIATTGIQDTDDEESESSDSTSKDTLLESGSGESEDDISSRPLHRRKKTKTFKHFHSSTVAPSKHYAKSNTHKPSLTMSINDETAEAERGETPDTVFANKMEADREEANNELEHNDISTETVDQLKISQVKDFHKEEENEITGKTSAPVKPTHANKQNKSEDGELHESEVKQKFTKESSANSEDNEDDLSETATNKNNDVKSLLDSPSMKSKAQNKTSANITKPADQVKSASNSTGPSEQTTKDINENTVTTAEDVRIEQVKEKPKAKSFPKEATVTKDNDQVDTPVLKTPTVTTDHAEQSEETLSKTELKIDADNSNDGKDNIKKTATNNDDKYETLEEVREKFKKWQNHLKDKSLSTNKPKNSTVTESASKIKTTSSKVELLDSEKEQEKEDKEPEKEDKEPEKITADGKSKEKIAIQNKLMKADDKLETTPNESTKLTDEEKDKAEKLKEIEDEKEESGSVDKQVKANKTEEEKIVKTKAELAKSWKEEEKMLLDRLKNPYLDENSKLKKYKEDETEEDEEDDLKKEIKNKLNKKDEEKEDQKEKQVDKKEDKANLNVKKKVNEAEHKGKESAEQNIKGHVNLKTKVEPAKVEPAKVEPAKVKPGKPPKVHMKLASDDNDEIVKSADKELSAVVDKIFANKHQDLKKLKKLTKNKSAALQFSSSKPTKKAFSGSKLGEKNLKQLAKFKAQILNEVAKIDSLQSEYGKDSHSTKDLSEAKEVLQKDLKVVKELEKSLLKKSSKNISKKHTKQLNAKHSNAKHSNAKQTNTKNQNKKTAVHFNKVNSDLDKSASAPNVDLSIGKEAETIDKEGDLTTDSEESIPEAKLGFDAESDEDKAREAEDEKLAAKEEEKLFETTGLDEAKVTSKHAKHKSHSTYAHAHQAGHKEERSEDNNHHLEVIHSLLKAEIKRLRERKKNVKTDAQLSNIRKLVQQRLKSMFASGELDKASFHTLAPDIKELGSLLKHRIKSENKKMKNKLSKKQTFKHYKIKQHNNNQFLTSFGHAGGHGKVSGQTNMVANAQQSASHQNKQDPIQAMIEKPVVPQDEPTPKIYNGVLPAIHGDSKDEVDSEMSKDMKGSLSEIPDLQKTHPEQNYKMKTLLKSLNQKLGEIYSKANKAHNTPPVSPGTKLPPNSQYTQNAQQNNAANQRQAPLQPAVTQQAPPQQTAAQQVPQKQVPAQQSPQKVLPQHQVSQTEQHQQRQDSPVPLATTNISSYQTQLAGAAGNALPGIYVPQNFAAPSSQDSVQADPQHAPSPAPNNVYNQPPQGKNELPPIMPSDDSDIEDTTPSKTLADDEPVDTLVESLERDITEVWSYRDMFPDADSLGLDNDKVHNTYANLGSLSGLNLRRALMRALRGEDVGLAIVGGSISKGGPFSEKGLDFVLRSFFYAVEDYWNKIIRPVTGSSMIIRDVSIGGIATDYYSYCLQNHLPDDKLTNIVLWELSANDMRRYDDGIKPLEQFTRNVLSYKARPALIFVNFFALFDWDPDLSENCRNYEDEGEDDVARHYKITSLSWRNMVCPLLRSGTQALFTRDRLFSEDRFHPSILGHAQMAYIVIDYIRTEFLKNLVKMRNTFIADAVTRLQIPKSIYIPKPMFKDTFLWKPICHTYMLVDNRSPNNTLPLDEENSSNFRYTVVREFKIRSDKIVGMETQQKDQYLRYRIHVPRHQNGGMEPYKRLGIMTFTDDRQAQVQFDSENPKTLNSKKKFLEGTLIKFAADNITPGEHELTIKSGSTGFLVCAIVLG